MSLRRCIENLKFDARMLDINIKSHVLTPDDLKKHLASLPDLQDQTLKVDLNSNGNGRDDLFPEPDMN